MLYCWCYIKKDEHFYYICYIIVVIEKGKYGLL